MHEFILWCAFVGGWLLFAGPIYQAGLELRAESLESDRIREYSTQIAPVPPTSNWWWLLPPAHWWIERRRREVVRRQIIDVMTDEDYEALSNYVNKATGWLFVGMGGFLIAAKETYELTEGSEWPNLVFWVLVVVMAGLSFANAVGRITKSERAQARRRSTAAERA